MIEQQAVVVSLEGDFARVETERKSTCGSCAATNTCGVSAMSKVMGQRRSVLRVLNEVGARPGDSVVVGLSESALLRGSLIIYITPLFSLFIFALVGRWLASILAFDSTEPMTIFCGLLGLLVGLVLLRFDVAGISRNKAYQAVILRRTGEVQVMFDGH